MENNSNTLPWTYSHTQLALYRLCPQRYWQAYVNNNKEPATVNMAFSTYMVHAPIETYVGGDQFVDWQASWELWWANMLAEANLTGDYDDDIFNMETGQQCFNLYKANPLRGEIRSIEKKVYQLIGGYRYVSKPDFLENDGQYQWSVDLKFTTAWQVPELLPYDDQLLGQAVCTGSDGFKRVTFNRPKKGKLTGPHVDAHLVHDVHKMNWLASTTTTIRHIEDERSRVRGNWGKNPASCYAYNKPCHHMANCKIGGYVV